MTPEERITQLENTVAKLIKSDHYFFERNIQILDGRNIVLSPTTGTKIGTSATQKIGFFGATPVVKPIAIGGTAAAIVGALQSLGLLQ